LNNQCNELLIDISAGKVINGGCPRKLSYGENSWVVGRKCPEGNKISRGNVLDSSWAYWQAKVLIMSSPKCNKTEQMFHALTISFSHLLM